MTQRRQADGFTLVELLLSVAILTIIVSSISTALIVFLKNGSEALARDDHSGGVELVGSYVDRDVASAATTSTSTKGGSDGCSSGTTTNLLELTWNEYTASSTNPSPAPQTTAYRAVYRLISDPDSDLVGALELRRSSCQGAVLSDTTILLRGLSTATRSTASVSSVSSSICPSTQQLTLNLAAYGMDTTTPYTFTTCLKTRITP